MVGLRSEIQHYCSCTPTGRNEACLLHGDPIDEKIDAGPEKARLDPDGTLKGKTALTAPVVGENGGVPFAGPASTHVNLESGRRTDLAPSYERVLSNWYNNTDTLTQIEPAQYRKLREALRWLVEAADLRGQIKGIRWASAIDVRFKTDPRVMCKNEADRLEQEITDGTP